MPKLTKKLISSAAVCTFCGKELLIDSLCYEETATSLLFCCNDSCYVEYLKEKETIEITSSAPTMTCPCGYICDNHRTNMLYDPESTLYFCSSMCLTRFFLLD